MIGIASDHGGVVLKKIIIDYLTGKGLDIIDFGTNSTDSVDYPDYAQKLATAVTKGECEKGIVICGTGIGISIAANKVDGIRCALCTNSFMAKMSREHNDSNVLALGERVLGSELAIDILDTWINTDFLGGRHSKRLDKISQIEKNKL